jgi:hypothetical protein
MATVLGLAARVMLKPLKNSRNTMKLIHSTVATFMALIFTLLSPMAIAGAGHDHGEAAPQTQGTALPRFVAVSEDLEMVGIVNGKQLTIYLDRFNDNSPVEVILKDTLKPGVIAITATIQAGELNDLLAAELDLHADEEEPSHGSSWKGIALWTGAGLFALIALGAIVRFRQQARTA